MLLLGLHHLKLDGNQKLPDMQLVNNCGVCSKVNDDSTMTSVRRMVSAIAGVSLNHRFLEHISRTGYFLPRKVLALAYIFCNTKGTEIAQLSLDQKKKESESLPFHQRHCVFFPCTILASLTYLSGLRPCSSPRVGLVYHVFSFVVDG